ncbi:MAG TPA: hypothetical protein VJA19_21290, partial [Pseudomonas sp.]|nr:hypothetical protein [Pseudomonas sp.]
SDPKVIEATPLPPQLYEPADNAEVSDFYPALRVQNSANGQGRALDYWFELYADAGMTQLLAKSAAISPGSNRTEWVVKADQLQPGAELKDNHRYYWRVRVSHSSGSSEWLNGRFFINTANDAPSAPLLLDPTPAGLVAQAQPRFRFNNSLDLDEDALSYRLRVFSEADEDFSQPLAEVSGLLPGADGVTEWQSPVSLEEDRFYFWLVEARDEEGALTQSEPGLFGVSLSNAAPSVPGLAWPLAGQSIERASGVVLRLDPAQDPERQPLTYRIQLDRNERFDSPTRLDSDWFGAGQAGVQWTLPGELEENQVYHWRARASDGAQESAWVAGSFRVNQLPESPPTPVASNPASGAWVEVRSPRLEVNPVLDPDGDALSYEFALHAEQGETPLASQVVVERSWTLPFALEDNQGYRWRVRALDATGLNSPWSDWQPFFVNENGVDDAPSLSFVQPTAPLSLSGGSVSIQWTDADPDSAATIDLYANERLIASAIKEDEDGDGDRFEWSLAGVEPGSYRLKAVIRDGTQAITVEACCSISLLPPTPEVRVTPVAGLQLDEYGEAVVEVDVRLDRSPRAGQSVTLNLALSDASEARLLNDPPYLYFSAENWQQAQRIRVQGVDDCSRDGTQTLGLELLPLQSSDPAFAGLDPQDLALTTLDNEQDGQSLFVCHYQVVARGAVDNAGLVDIRLRAELLNTGVALVDATATPSVQGAGVELSGAASVRFSPVLNGIRSQAQDEIVLRQPASQPLQFSRVHWALVPGAVADVTQGQAGNDTLVGTDEADIIDGGAGDDWINGGEGADVLGGGAGMDVLLGGGGDDTLLVTGQDMQADYFNGGPGHDQVLGGDDDDVIRLHQFIDDMRVELIDGRGGKNRIEGTADKDALNFSDTELRNIELIDGLAGDDIIYGSQGNDVIRGGADNDQLYGNDGDDNFLFEGDQGVDSVSGGEGVDRILGSPGDDWIRLKGIDAQMAVEFIDGGEGLNYLTGDAGDNSLDLRETTLSAIARIDGLEGADSIAGSQGSDVIQGGPGDDTLYGFGGDDLFVMLGSNAGFDLLSGGEDRDGLKGGAGDDVFGLQAFGGEYRVEWIDGDGGFNRILGGALDNTFDFRETRLIGINEIDLGAGDDSVFGSSEADVLVGGPGNDQLFGGAGNDSYRFGPGDGMDYVRDLGLPADFDRLLLDVPFGPERIWLKSVGHDLHVMLLGSADLVVLAGVQGPEQTDIEQNRIELIELANGRRLSVTAADALVQVMASMPMQAEERSAEQNEQLASALEQAWVQP